MPGKIAPAPESVYAMDSQPRQLRLPLMAREERSNGLPSPNPDVVDRIRLFVVKRRAATAKDIAALTGSRSARILNEDEARVVHSTANFLVSFLSLSGRDQRRLLNKQCQLAGLPLYAVGERDLDDSLVGVAR